MILNSFLAGFLSYIAVIIYNLVQGESLKRVFLSGIKFLLLITLLAAAVQLTFHFIFSYLKNSSETKEAKAKIETKEKIDKEVEEDFSPLNPPAIEYEDQKEQ